MLNVFNGMEPRLIARVDTPGDTRRVAVDGGLVAAVGDHPLLVIDIREPSAPVIRHEIESPTPPRVVATGGGFAYAGFDSGGLWTIDLEAGTVLERMPFGVVQDFALSGDHLYALTSTSLTVLKLRNGLPERLSQLSLSPVPPPRGERGRGLFAGGDSAYVGHVSGYFIIDVSDPARPTLCGEPPTPQLSVHDLAANGSGLLLTIGSFTGSDTHTVSPYDVSGADCDVTLQLTSYETTGVPRSLAINNGLAYTADGEGIKVVNYLGFDAQGVAPAIDLEILPGDDQNVVEKGTTLTLSARVSDDVQVRNVAFLVNGERVATDGSFPFEARIRAPFETASGRISISARATDTGGNETTTSPVDLTLVDDLTPPRVVSHSPVTRNTDARTVAAFLGEPLDAGPLSPDTLSLFAAGPDGIADTADDVRVDGGHFEYREAVSGLFLSFDAPLPVGPYRAVVDSGTVRDLNGNALAEDFSWSFWSSAPTSISGRIELADGTPVGDAEVTVRDVLGEIILTAVSGPGGVIDLPVLADPGTLSVTVRATINGELLIGNVALEQTPAGGVLDGGTIVLRPVDDDDGAVFGNREYPGSSGIRGFALADVDGDGFIDITSADRRQLFVARNAGDATFEPAASYGLSFNVQAFKAGDLDGDGDVDFLAHDGQRSFHTISNQDGVLESTSSLDTGLEGFRQLIGLADLDQDGDLDGIVQSGSLILSILNAGDGSFSDGNTVDAGAFVLDVRAADLDGRRGPDLVAVLSDEIAVFLNRGDGTFAAPLSIAASAVQIGLGDLNRDGNIDAVALLGQISVTASVFHGDGTGNLEWAYDRELPNGPANRVVALGTTSQANTLYIGDLGRRRPDRPGDSHPEDLSAQQRAGRLGRPRWSAHPGRLRVLDRPHDGYSGRGRRERRRHRPRRRRSVVAVLLRARELGGAVLDAHRPFGDLHPESRTGRRRRRRRRERGSGDHPPEFGQPAPRPRRRHVRRGHAL